MGKLSFYLFIAWSYIELSCGTPLKERCDKKVTASLNHSKILAHYYRGACYVLDGLITKSFDQIQCNHFPESGHVAFSQGRQILERLYEKFKPDWSRVGIYPFAFIGVKATQFNSSANKSAERDNFYWWVSDQVKWKAPEFALKWYPYEPGGSSDNCGHMWNAYTQVFGYPCSAKIAYVCEYRDASIEYGKFVKPFRGISSQTFREESATDQTACANLCTKSLLCQSYTHSTDGLCALHFLPTRELSTVQLGGAVIYDILNVDDNCDSQLLFDAPAAVYTPPLISPNKSTTVGGNAVLTCQVDHCPGTTSTEADTQTTTCTEKGWNPLAFSHCELRYRCNKTITTGLNKTKLVAHYHRGSCYVLDYNTPQTFDQIHCNHFLERGYPALIPGKKILQKLYEIFTPKWSGIHDFAYVGLRAPHFISTANKSIMKDQYYWWVSNEEQWKAPQFGVNWSPYAPDGSSDHCGHMWRTQKYMYGYPCGSRLASVCEYRDHNSIGYNLYQTGFRGSSDEVISEESAADIAECLNQCKHMPICQSFSYDGTAGLCALYFLPASELATQQSEGVMLYDTLDYNCECDPKVLEAPSASYSAIRMDGKIDIHQTATLSCKEDHCPKSNEVVATASSKCTKRGWHPLSISITCDLKYRCHKTITSALNQTKIIAHYHRGSCFVLDGTDLKPSNQIRCNHLPEKGYPTPLPGKHLVQEIYDLFNADWAKQGIHDFAYIGLKAEPFTYSSNKSEMREHYKWWLSNEEQWKAPGTAVKWHNPNEPDNNNELCGHLWRTSKDIYGYPCGQRLASLCEYRDQSIEYGVFSEGFQGYSDQMISEHTTADVQGCSKLCQQMPICQSFLFFKETAKCVLYFLPATELSSKQMKGAKIYDTLDHSCNCKSENLLAPSAIFPALNTDGSVDLGEAATLTCKPDHCDQVDGEEIFSSICTKNGWKPLNFFSPPCALKYRCHKAITSTLNKTKILVHYHRGSCFVLDGNDVNAFDQKRCSHFPERGHLAPLPGKQTIQKLYDVFRPNWSKEGIHSFAYFGLKASPFPWSGNKSEMREQYYWWISDQERWKAPESAVKWYNPSEPGHNSELCGHLWNTAGDAVFAIGCTKKIAQLCEYRDYDAIEFQSYKQGVRGLINVTFREQQNTNSMECAEFCKNYFLCQSYTFQQQNGLCSLHYLPAAELWTEPLKGAALYDLAELGCTCDPASLDAPTATFSATRKDGQIDRGKTATLTCSADEYAEIKSQKVQVQTLVCTSKGWDGAFSPCQPNL